MKITRPRRTSGQLNSLCEEIDCGSIVHGQLHTKIEKALKLSVITIREQRVGQCLGEHSLTFSYPEAGIDYQSLHLSVGKTVLMAEPAIGFPKLSRMLSQAHMNRQPAMQAGCLGN